MIIRKGGKDVKHIRCCLILFSLLILLTSCNRPSYVPEGDVYAKTSPAYGDAGVSLVTDLEIESEKYIDSKSFSVPVRVGVGHRPSDTPDGEGCAYVILRARYDTTPAGEFVEVARLDFPDFETAKYNSTEPEPDRSFLVIPIYGEFYPTQRQTVTWAIPDDAQSGRLEAELHEIDAWGNHYKLRPATIYFERREGKVIFSGD